jgi:thiamine pyrophosphate-dependent acetolactate synthase large subunit-like protein
MSLDEYFEVLHEQWRDEIVVCSLGTSSNMWWSRTESRTSFYVSAAMGFASSFAFGLAINCPDHRVWLLDSDGAVAMNLGGLVTEASIQPSNLLHLVLNNHCYGSLGGGELVNADQTDYSAIARGAGIENVAVARSGGELAAAVSNARDEHAFVVAEVDPGAKKSGFEPPPRVPFDGPELKYIFGRNLEQIHGRPVFGPNGY